MNKTINANRPILSLKKKTVQEESIPSAKQIPLTPEAARLKRKAHLAKVMQQLLTQYPNCFDNQAPKPLMIGVAKVLYKQFESVSRNTLRTLLRNYTTTTRYLKAITEHSQRVNLDGEPVEAITEEHQLAARNTLNFRKRRNAKKKHKASTSEPSSTDNELEQPSHEKESA